MTNNAEPIIIKHLRDPLLWIGIVVFIVMAVLGIMESSDRDMYTTGVITDYQTCAVTGVCVGFSYTIDDNTFQGHGTPSRGLKACENTGWCIGKKYRVKYSSKNPQNSVILLDEPMDE